MYFYYKFIDEPEDKGGVEFPCDEPGPSEGVVNVLCLAAAPIEFETGKTYFQKRSLPSNQRYDGVSESYYIEFLDSNAKIRWILCRADKQGNLATAKKADNAIKVYSPDLMVMFGMCMGMPKSNFEVGTVALPTAIVSYEHQRATINGTEYRPREIQCTNMLYAFARDVFDEKALGFSVVKSKKLANASIKIENIEAPLIKLIEGAEPDVAFYDMEGYGFLDFQNRIPAIWVKAVSDNGESQSSAHDNVLKKQSVQSDATNNSLEYVRCVIEAFVAHSNTNK